MSEPNTLLEDRLTAALAARANQVDTRDLTPAEVPGPAGQRRRGLIVLAAAACTALVIGVPYAIAQLDTTPKPHRPPVISPPSPTPTPTSTPTSEGVGWDWPIARVGRIDLDGDGSDETMRLRIEPSAGTRSSDVVRVRVEVSLPDRTVFTVVWSGTTYRLEGAAHLLGAKGQELLLAVDARLEVFALVDGQLTRLEAPDDPTLLRGTDSQDRLVTWMTDSTGLYSIRATRPYHPGEGDDDRYDVERWRWHVVGGALKASAPTNWCVRESAPTEVILCQDYLSPEWPLKPSMFAPSRLEFVEVGTKVGVVLTEPGGIAHAELVDEGGRFQLVVVDDDPVTGEGPWRAHVPTGGVPELASRLVLTSPGTQGLLIRQPTREGETWTAYTWLNGDLLAVTQPAGEVRPGVGRTEDGTPYFSWVQQGWIFTAVGDGPDKEIYRWEIDGDHFVRSSLGTYCFDDAGTAPCE